MRELNDREWERRSDEWVKMQERSRKAKEEAEKQGKKSDERRQYWVQRSKG